MISVVLPIYNEEKGLISFIDDLYTQLKDADNELMIWGIVVASIKKF